MTPVDHSAYRSAQASYQLDMATPIYAQTRRRSAGPVFGNVPQSEQRAYLAQSGADLDVWRFHFVELPFVGHPFKGVVSSVLEFDA